MLYFFMALFSTFTVFGLSAINETEIMNKHLSVLEKVKLIIEEDIKEHQIPGVAIALYDGNQEYFLSYGHADVAKQILVNESTLFKIGSITKVFTSTLLATLVLNQKVQLNDPLTKFIKLKTNNPDTNKITLLHLATHTASLPRDFPNPEPHSKITEDKIQEFLTNWKTPYPVATQYSYSNLGFQILGMALMSFNNSDYASMLETDVLKPLKMDSTFVNVPSQLQGNIAVGYNVDQPVSKEPVHGLVPGSGAYLSSSSDMLKFLKANLGVDGPKNLISAMEYAQKGFFSINKQQTLGLGWNRFINKDGVLIINKNGGLPGYSSYIGFTKDRKKVGVVLLSNLRGVDLTLLGRKILTELQ